MLAGRAEQSQIVTGLRGVGKTVLLNTFEDLAEQVGYLTAFRELTQESSLPELVAKDAQRLLRELKLSAKLAAAVRAGLSTLGAFKLTDPNGFELSLATSEPEAAELIFMAGAWKPVLEAMAAHLVIDERDLARVTVCAGAREAVEHIARTGHRPARASQHWGQVRPAQPRG